jgi:hypothetical protein
MVDRKRTSPPLWSRTILRRCVCRTGEPDRCTIRRRSIVSVVSKFGKNVSTSHLSLPGDRCRLALATRQRPVQEVATQPSRTCYEGMLRGDPRPMPGTGVPRRRHVSPPTSARASSVNVAQDKIDRPDDEEGRHLCRVTATTRTTRHRPQIRSGLADQLERAGRIAAKLAKHGPQPREQMPKRSNDPRECRDAA